MLWQCPVAPGIKQWLLDDLKILVSFRNDLLGTLDFTGLEHWALFNFSQSTVVRVTKSKEIYCLPLSIIFIFYMLIYSIP